MGKEVSYIGRTFFLPWLRKKKGGWARSQKRGRGQGRGGGGGQRHLGNCWGFQLGGLEKENLGERCEEHKVKSLV